MQGGKGISSIIVAVVGILVAFYVMVSVLTGHGNVIGALYRYLLIGGFFMGILIPRTTFISLILMCGYIDVFKKLLVAGQYLSFLDLFFVLGIPAVALSGICWNIVIGFGTGRIPTSRRNVSYFIVALVIVIVLSAIAIMKLHLNLGVLKLLANSASYFALLFVVPVLFPNADRILRMLRFIILAMIPAAIHGLYHYFGGLLEFEELYMMSGLSINKTYLGMGEGVFGPFSSQGTLSATMTTCATLSLLPFLIPKQYRKMRGFFPKWLGVVLCVLFLSAAIFSLKRGPLLILPLALCTFVVLGSRKLLAACYILGPLMFVLVVLNAQALADALPEWQRNIDNLIGGRSDTKLTKIRTMNVRFEELTEFTKPKNWEPFGVVDMEEMRFYGVHVGLVGVFMKYGWLPMLTAIGLAVPFLINFHRRILQGGSSLEAFLARFGAAMALSLYGVTMIGFGEVTAFPNPFFIAFFLAVFANFAFHRKRSAAAPEQVEAQQQRGLGMDPVRRLSPS